MSNITRRYAEQTLGVSIDIFSKMKPEEERIFIEKKIGKKLKYSKVRKLGRIGRGSALLARNKYKDDDTFEQKSKELFGI